jgi:hypothetical protein
MNAQQALAVKKIVANFTEQDDQAVYSEVERLDKQFRIHHFTEMLRQQLPGMEPEVLELGSDSIEYQELASGAIWDCLTELVKHQRALEIYKRMHQYDEVA